MPLFASFRNMASCGTEIEEDRWIRSSEVRVVVLQLYPPQNARRGKIDIEVSQRSSGRKAVVEFSLDAAATGPGCFTI
jgi:hypothetical protein